MKHLEQFNLSPLVAVLDIETTATSVNARIGSIGCVVVNVFTGEEVGSFYGRADLDSQFGRVSDQATLEWWESQRNQYPAAWAELFSDELDRQRLPELLQGLALFLEVTCGTDRVQLMGNGPEFDNAILTHAYEQEGIAVPWHYGGNQSLRTAVLFGRLFLGIDPKYNIEFDGTRHHAEDDARHEARYLTAITQRFFDLVNPRMYHQVVVTESDDTAELLRLLDEESYPAKLAPCPKP